MIRQLSPEESLQSRRSAFDKMEPQQLYSYSLGPGDIRCFIVIAKHHDDPNQVLVVQLTRTNMRAISSGERAQTSLLHFDQLHCLNFLNE